MTQPYELSKDTDGDLRGSIVSELLAERAIDAGDELLRQAIRSELAAQDGCFRIAAEDPDERCIHVRLAKCTKYRHVGRMTHRHDDDEGASRYAIYAVCKILDHTPM